MRIQEHIFQGFFGIKKKEDSEKYYSERVNKLTGLDKNLDKGIESFQSILENHRKKLDAYFAFLKKMNRETLASLRTEILRLEGMFDQDELSNENEKRYVIRIEQTLKGLSTDESSTELNQLEKDVIEDIRTLSTLLQSIGPLWEKQIEFIKKNDEEIMSNKSNLKVLSDILKEEGDILRIEESLLKKIDLKTGVILRKTTLQMRNVEKTKDMNLNYREIKHIR